MAEVEEVWDFEQKGELRCISTGSLNKAIVHIDLNCFFAAAEQQRDFNLRGKSVIIGQERGIATSMSPEAKAAGVTRGMKLADIKKICPDCILIPSDYETYGLYSLRFFDIVRQFSEQVEEYSIDECFVDITGLKKVFNTKRGYREIAEKIKHDVETKLGTKCSVGVSTTKTLAKTASKYGKSDSLTVIRPVEAQYYLRNIPVGKIWNIGPQTEAHLNKIGVKTALDFAYMRRERVEEMFDKPIVQAWMELKGVSCLELNTEPITLRHGLSKTKTFRPPTKNIDEAFSRLSKDVESCCIGARKLGLMSKQFSFWIKSENFKYSGFDGELMYPTNDPHTFLNKIRETLPEIFNPRIEYRTAIFCMNNLKGDSGQRDLFGWQDETIKRMELFKTVDEIQGEFGKHTLHTATTDFAIKVGDHQGDRGEKPWRKRPENLLPHENNRQRVDIPYCGPIK